MIGVLTYNYPHRKTQDLLYMLKLYGQREVTVYATPWVERDNFKPLYQHRPEAHAPYPDKVARALGYEFQEIPHPDEAKGHKILIAGAGIITPRPNVINAHPGYLPYNRGLDALKWAIYDGTPIGVTTYIIGDECDTGELLNQNMTVVLPTDDFYTLAMRHYWLEIKMLASTVDSEPCGIKLGTEYEAHRRMPHGKELIMMKRFNQRRNNESN